MRREVDVSRVKRFMLRIGQEARGAVRVYLTGGACAVLLGWRPTTIDVDVRFEPERPEVFAGLPRLKAELDLNIELASPQDFIPELPGWRERSVFVDSHGNAQFFHYDFYAQALAKLERSHDRDLDDVRAMVKRGLVEPARLLPLLDQVLEEAGRYPAIDFDSFRERVRIVATALSGAKAADT